MRQQQRQIPQFHAAARIEIGGAVEARVARACANTAQQQRDNEDGYCDFDQCETAGSSMAPLRHVRGW